MTAIPMKSTDDDVNTTTRTPKSQVFDFR